MNIPKLLQQSVSYLNAGDAAAADPLLKRILKKQPKHLDALNLAGVAAYELQQYERARTLLARVVKADRKHGGARLNLGAVFNAMQDYGEAEHHYRAALALNPDSATILNNLGKNCLDRNELDDAVTWLRRAVAADADYWIARHNLGTAERRLGDVEASIETFRDVLTRAPNADTYSELIRSLRRTSRFDEEYACAKQLLALPGAGDAAIGAWESLFDACDWDAIEQHENNMMALMQAPQTRAAHRTGGLILLHSLPFADPETTYTAHRAWAQSLPPATVATRQATSGRKLKIGYLSPDFRDHSVGFFIRNVIAAHDPMRFEVYCYSNSAERDDTTELIARSAAHFSDVSALGDEALITRIVDDGIDLLIDLAGHTRDSRVAILNHRLAPVQLTYLGYPNTTGLDNVDFRISDPYSDSATGTRYSESLLEMPESFLCFGAFDEVPRAGATPASDSGQITFGSFNNIRKINPAIVATWSEVLQRVPGSRFMIKSRRAAEPVTQQHLLGLFARHGIAAERIVMLPPTVSRADHLAAYNTVDIVLDTFPYHGTTTTCEALWMGVPVVTLGGETHAQRVSCSILKNLGLDHLVTWDAADYIARAVALATDLPSLEALRDEIPGRIRDSILCDPVRFTAQFEAVLCAALAHVNDVSATAVAG